MFRTSAGLASKEKRHSLCMESTLDAPMLPKSMSNHGFIIQERKGSPFLEPNSTVCVDQFHHQPLHSSPGLIGDQHGKIDLYGLMHLCNAYLHSIITAKGKSARYGWFQDLSIGRLPDPSKMSLISYNDNAPTSDLNVPQSQWVDLFFHGSGNQSVRVLQYERLHLIKCLGIVWLQLLFFNFGSIPIFGIQSNCSKEFISVEHQIRADYHPSVCWRCRCRRLHSVCHY
jgi:hypothetical protein